MKRLAIPVCCALAASLSAQSRYTTWSEYGGSPDDAQYSALKQVNRSNVANLELAWHFPVPGTSGRFGFNPLVVEGTMYVLGPSNAIVALDAATGKQIWSHAVEGGRREHVG